MAGRDNTAPAFGVAAGTRGASAAATGAAIAAAAAAIAGSNHGAAADADGDEGKSSEDDELPAAAAAGIDVAAMMRQMQAMQTKIDRLQQAQPLSLGSAQSASPQPSSASSNTGEIASLIRVIMDGQVAAAEQARKQTSASNAQFLTLQSLGVAPSFDGKGADTTLRAREWVRSTDDFHAAREQALGIDAVQGDQARLLSGVNSLTDDARRWYNALPVRPLTWPLFRTAIEARFCSVPDERIRVENFNKFVGNAEKLREKLNLQGMQAFTARFAQMAGEVPDDHIPLHGKLAALARGLPLRYAEVVMREDSRKPTPPLHEVINTVLSRAATKEHAASFGVGASSSPASAAPLGLDAVSLAAATFGWSREEAQSHLVESWAAHDTQWPPNRSAASEAASAASSASLPPTSEQIERYLNAMAAQTRVGAGPTARHQQQSRRNVPSSITKEVPQELYDARKSAGLCAKCGITKYEPGANGHNARTCKLPVDKTISAVDGRKKAGF